MSFQKHFSHFSLYTLRQFFLAWKRYSFFDIRCYHQFIRRQKCKMAEEQDPQMNIDDSELVDKHCLADKPVRVTFRDVTSAAFLIKSGIERTSCPVNRMHTYRWMKMRIRFLYFFLPKYLLEIEIDLQWNGIVFKKWISSIYGKVFMIIIERFTESIVYCEFSIENL